MSRSSSEVDALGDLTRAIASGEHFSSFRSALEALGAVLDCATVELWLADGADRLARCSYSVEGRSFRCETLDRQEGSDRDHAAFVVAMLGGDARTWHQHQAPRGTIIAAPLIRGGNRAGALVVTGCRSDTERVGALLVSVAEQLAPATDAHLATIALEEARHRLALVENIAHAILHRPDPAETLRHSCEAAAAIFNGLQVGYVNVDEASQAHVLAAAGVEAERVRGRRLDLSSAHRLLAAIREKHVVVIDDARGDEVDDALRELCAELNVKAFVCVPVEVRGALVGMVFFASPQTRRWTRLEVESLMEAAELLFIAARTSEQEMIRREAEAMLRRERDMLTRILDVAATPLLVVQNGEIVVFNRECERLSGYSAAEVIGRPARDLPFVDPADMQRLRSEYESQPSRLPRLMEVGWVSRSGERRTVLWHLGVTNEGETTTIVASGVDVTQTQRLREELDQAKRIASLGRLSATVAHEFNNVMMSILPFTEVIRHAGADNPKIQNAVGHMVRAIDRGRRVTQDLLRFTRPGEPTRRRIDAAQWLRDVANESRALLPENIRLETDICDEPLFIEADPLQLGQVLNNLVINARDAMKDGGTLKLTLAAAAEPVASDGFAQAKPAAVFRVIDSGTGIPPQVRESVFEPLFTTKKNGTGLGLAIARQIVVRHDGAIFVDSEEGKGTTFTIVLPRVTAA